MLFILIASIKTKAHATEIKLGNLLLVARSVLSAKGLTAGALIIQIISKNTYSRDSRTGSGTTVKFTSMLLNSRT